MLILNIVSPQESNPAQSRLTRGNHSDRPGQTGYKQFINRQPSQVS